MTRKAIPEKTVTEVLLRSRRRCCICYGLNRDTAIKSGQIAHLDRNSANADIDNLAFLCLDHHDEYDSSTSQRKGLTIGEVKAFRDELADGVFKTLEQSVRFGVVELPPDDPYAGRWIRVDTGVDSSEINLIPLPDNIEGLAQYYVSGFAIHDGLVPESPNIGSLEEIGILYETGLIEVSFRFGQEQFARLQFDDDQLVVIEDIVPGYFGAGVTFQGRYKRS